MKDLLDAFYMNDGQRDVVLYAVSIDPQQLISMELSRRGASARDIVVAEILREVGNSTS